MSVLARAISLPPSLPTKPASVTLHTHPQYRLRTRIFGKYLVDHSLGRLGLSTPHPLSGLGLPPTASPAEATNLSPSFIPYLVLPAGSPRSRAQIRNRTYAELPFGLYPFFP